MGLLSYIDKRFHHIRRYNQIVRVLFRYGFQDLVAYLEEHKRLKAFRKLIPRGTYKHAMHLSKWEKMRLVCEELGPTFVKFGQILSNRPDILPAGLIQELEKLQDNVPPIDGDMAKRVVEQELGKPVEELFAVFDKEPFASASMAQVHRATLKSGEKVVLKIQRPGIQEVIQSDIRVMFDMAAIFRRRIPSLKSFDPVGLVRHFEESIMKELDFIHESINVQRFHSNFKEDERGNAYIYSPIVYREYTTSKVLTLEYVEGVKISLTDKLDRDGMDRKKIAKRLAMSYFKQVFDYGFFHADPHPGNLFVLPNEAICYLDYGMMGSIMRKDVVAFGHLFLAVGNKDIKDVIRSIQHLTGNVPIRNMRQLEFDLNEFVHNYSVRQIHENELSTVLMELKDIIVRHKLKVPTHFFLLARSMVTIEGVIRKLDPDLDLNKIVRPYLIKTAAREYNPLTFSKKILNAFYEMGVYMEEFPRDLRNAIRKINTGEIKVDLRHKGIDPLVHTFNRVSKQLVSAILMASLIIGSSLLVIEDVGPKWGETSALGVSGFIIAGLLGIGIFRDWNKGDHDDWPGWEE